jgi:hypothetical protein
MYVMPTPRSKKRILDRLQGILHALPD